MTGVGDVVVRKEVLEGIGEAKKKLGKDLLILAHFYQHDDIVRFGDFVGDSLQLAEKASSDREARYIVFCSVSFMAETARILCRPEQEVFHPDPRAMCPLADMADIGKVEKAWKELARLNKTIIPVVYVNSNADLKAFCGRNGGLVCTSANVRKVFQHVLSRNASLFFFPDENMGRNIAHDLGLRNDELLLWNEQTGAAGGILEAEKAKVFLWPGFCIVHRVMGGQDIERLRNEHEGIKIIVHPECTPEVYNLADAAGSTSFIKKTIEEAPPGSKWAVGTEWHFVKRIKAANPDKLVIPLREERCTDMAKVTPEKLLYVLEDLIEGKRSYTVSVDKDVASEAKTALTRMLEIS